MGIGYTQEELEKVKIATLNILKKTRNYYEYKEVNPTTYQLSF